MRARSVARFTDARVTPGTLASAFSTRSAHEAQVIPPMSSSAVRAEGAGASVVLCGSASSVMVGKARGGIGPRHEPSIDLPMMGRSRANCRARFRAPISCRNARSEGRRRVQHGLADGLLFVGRACQQGFGRAAPVGRKLVLAELPLADQARHL